MPPRDDQINATAKQRLQMQTYACERETHSKINSLQKLLGPETVLLSCHGKRPIDRGWQNLTPDVMRRPDYLRRLHLASNIGVLLGKLCVVDIDEDGADEDFLASNPKFRGTLRSKGRRGSSFWVIITGDCPSSRKLKRNGKLIGEWRSTGNQSIIHGLHPDTGQPYQILNRVAPIEICFDEINLWDGLTNTLQPNHVRCSVSSVPSVSLSFSVTVLNECDIVELSIARDVHTSHRALFNLARGILTLERSGQNLSSGELQAIFDRWYQSSLPNLRPEQSQAAYFQEFLDACDCVEHGLDENTLDRAWEQSKKVPLPAVAQNFKSRKVVELVCLCAQLQKIVGDREFFLSCRSAGTKLEISHVQAAKFLKVLVRRKVCFKSLKQGVQKLIALPVTDLLTRGTQNHSSNGVTESIYEIFSPKTETPKRKQA